ncbi:hypothetical protein B0E34_02620 [Chryseobacterium mucoviscidosis]|uniref:Uncharacterized protein n=1 Tax=Chryseobacterium mucoviscidosis TaxID=1945581 RepID=A0A202CBU1_9FLAO|nr:hypothetical protein B0E34_02620 [Chryseobacterium mucoviscidosis]
MRKLSYVLLLLSLINCKNKSSVFEVKINHVSKNIIDELKHLKADNHLKLYFQHPQKGILEIRDNKIQLTYYEIKNWLSKL